MMIIMTMMTKEDNGEGKSSLTDIIVIEENRQLSASRSLSLCLSNKSKSGRSVATPNNKNNYKLQFCRCLLQQTV